MAKTMWSAMAEGSSSWPGRVMRIRVRPQGRRALLRRHDAVRARVNCQPSPRPSCCCMRTLVVRVAMVMLSSCAKVKNSASSRREASVTERARRAEDARAGRMSKQLERALASLQAPRSGRRTVHLEDNVGAIACLAVRDALVLEVGEDVPGRWEGGEGGMRRGVATSDHGALAAMVHTAAVLEAAGLAVDVLGQGVVVNVVACVWE